MPLDYPCGLNVDGVVVLDTQVDGGVDAIEIVYPLGERFTSGSIAPLQGERFWRLYVNPSDKALVEQQAEVSVQLDDDGAIITLIPGDIDSEYKIGPGVRALLGTQELRALRVDLGRLRISR